MTFKQKLKIALIAVCLAFALSANASNDVPASEPKTSNKNEDTRSGQMLQRLQEIKSMDKSELTRLEKNDLCKEVLNIKKERKAMSGGVYLSVGAILIVVLVLLLIL